MRDDKGSEGSRQIGPFRYMIREARWLLVAEAVIFAVAATLYFPPRPLLLWNVSTSAPTGLYFVGRKDKVARRDMVAARVPERSRAIAARRGYVPMNVPLVKRVAALSGDVVCAKGAEVRVNGKIVATRRTVDARGREMPHWSGCVHLVEDDYFLLMSENASSFDGRYFGVSHADDIVGEVALLWRR